MQLWKEANFLGKSPTKFFFPKLSHSAEILLSKDHWVKKDVIMFDKFMLLLDLLTVAGLNVMN